MMSEKDFKKQIKEAYFGDRKISIWKYIAIAVIILIFIIFIIPNKEIIPDQSVKNEIKTESEAAALQQDVGNLAIESSSIIRNMKQTINSTP